MTKSQRASQCKDRTALLKSYINTVVEIAILKYLILKMIIYQDISAVKSYGVHIFPVFQYS